MPAASVWGGSATPLFRHPAFALQCNAASAWRPVVSVLDDHNRQHTFGNSLGPPTSVAGVSAQQAIDANQRGLGEPDRHSATTAPLRWKDHVNLAVGGSIVAGLAALAAYPVGGFGAVAFGLVALLAGIFGLAFLLAAIISAATYRSA